MQDFFRFKNGPFSQKAKKLILRDSKRSSFITDFFVLQFDTATLIIHRLEVANRGSNLIYYVNTWYLVGLI